MNAIDQVALYRLLARALTYPEGGFSGTLQEAASRLGLELFNDQALPIAAFMQAVSELGRLPLDQLQGEHTRLFINGFPRVSCPPYESAYREGELAGRSAETVDGAYRQWGLVAEAEEVDHAGAELEFLAFLMSLDAPEAVAAADDFLASHALVWLPRFAEDVARESSLGFYQATGRLLAALLRPGSDAAG